MFMLGPTDSLSGVASTSGVEFAATGDTVISQADNLGVIAQLPVPTSVGALIAAVAGSQRLIRNASIFNSNSGASATVTLYMNGTTTPSTIRQFIIPALGCAEHSDDGWKVFDGNGILQQGVTSGFVTGVTATDTSVVVDNTIPTAPKLRTNTLDVVAAQHPPVAAVAMSTQKLTGLQNGSAAQDSAAYGQTPAGGNAVTSAQMASMVANTVKGNATGGTATPTDLTQAQLTALVNLATTALPGALAAADFQHIPSGWIDVTRQGVNSMSTGATQAANTTALGNIMTAAPSGSVLYLPPGWLPINKMTIPGKVFMFMGSGAGLNGALSAFTTSTDQAGDWFAQTAADYYMCFRDVGFISQAAQSAGACINVSGNANNNIYDCEFTGLSNTTTLHDCITFGGANGGEESIVAFSDFTNFTGTALNCNCNLSTVVFTGNTINGGLTATTGAACGINITLGGAVQISDSDIIGCTNNLLINPSVTPVASVFCTNTYFDNSFGSCVKITGAGGSVRNKFTNCSMTCAANASPANAVEVSSTFAYGAVGMGLDFISCNVLNTFGTLGVGTGFNITGAGDFRIEGCNIAAWAVGIDVTPANSAGMTRPQIQNNTIGNAGGYGVNTIGTRFNVGSFTYGNLIYEGNNDSGNTTPLTDNSTIIAGQRKIINNNLGLVCAPMTQVPNLALVITTVQLAGVNVPIPAGVRAGTKVRIIAHLTNSASAQTLTPTLRFGTAGTNADASICGLGLGAGTAAVGGGKVTAEVIFTSATTCIASIHTLNSVVAAAGVGTAGLTNLPSQTSMGGGSTPGPVTIATASASFLGLYLSTTVGAVVTVRTVEYEVIQQ